MTMPTPVGNLGVDVDWDHDQLFANADSVITSYVMALSWRSGFSLQYEPVSPPSEAIITLNNASGDWNVGKSTAKFHNKTIRGTLVRILYNSDIMYIGKIISLEVKPGEFGERTAILRLSDWMIDLQEASFEPQLAGNVTTGFALASQVFESGVVPHPYADVFWMLDVSELDSTTQLYENTALTLTDQGQTVLGYVGDNLDTGGGINARSFIEEMCIAEMSGRFWYDCRTGSYIFRDRHGWLSRAPLAGTGNRLRMDNMIDGTYTYSENLLNHLTVTVYPRSIGSAGTALYRSEQPIYVPPADQRVITARYRDPDNPQRSCSALVTVEPLSGTDFLANTADDGSGADVTSSLSLSIEPGRSSAKVILHNGSASGMYVTLLQIRGTPLVAHEQLDVTKLLPESIAEHGLRKKAITIAGTDDLELISDFMAIQLRQFGYPELEWRDWSCIIKGDGTDFELNIVFGGTTSLVGRVLYLDETWSQSAMAMVSIISEAHDVNVAANRWQMTLGLEPFKYEKMWVLDSGALDSGTIVGF